jgi:hypothetical protein
MRVHNVGGGAARGPATDRRPSASQSSSVVSKVLADLGVSSRSRICSSSSVAVVGRSAAGLIIWKIWLAPPSRGCPVGRRSTRSTSVGLAGSQSLYQLTTLYLSHFALSQLWTYPDVPDHMPSRRQDSSRPIATN